jgi:thymidylate synthase (FAD)
MDIARACKRIFICTFPTVAEALEWKCPNDDCKCEEIQTLQPSLRID